MLGFVLPLQLVEMHKLPPLIAGRPTCAHVLYTLYHFSEDVNVHSCFFSIYTPTEHDDKQGTNTRGALQEVYFQLSLDNQRNDKFLEHSNIIILLTDGKY